MKKLVKVVKERKKEQQKMHSDSVTVTIGNKQELQNRDVGEKSAKIRF